MTPPCKLPQELADIIISFCLTDIQLRTNLKDEERLTRSRQILALRLVCPEFNTSIEDCLPRMDEFYAWKILYPILARLRLLHAVQQVSQTVFPLASAVRRASELILNIRRVSSNEEREQERRNVWKTICLSVTRGVIAGRPADNKRNNVVWEQSDWEEATHTIAIGTAACEGDVYLLRTLMNQGLYTGFAVDHVFEDPMLTAMDMGRDDAAPLTTSSPLSTISHSASGSSNEQLQFAAESGDLGLFVRILDDTTLDTPGRGLFVENAQGLTPGTIASRLGWEAIVEEVCRRFNSGPENLLDDDQLYQLESASDNAIFTMFDDFNSEKVQPQINAMLYTAAVHDQLTVMDTIRRCRCKMNAVLAISVDERHHPVYAAAANGHFEAARILMSLFRPWGKDYEEAAWLGLLGSARSGMWRCLTTFYASNTHIQGHHT
ncbi:uncharacterized protein DSM5745_04090 [Aspergillus mulundensis]|uniref:Uncharacterized protein n=1 Tax=Aspergillus mulundensis TaxID=1810919 RepID=A0A3D8SCE9_9EURO|nr:hypothetical protein DSM5745_04090 [Aspergillus mulundensis]RDW83764.1 hypothetical protein DSM5745_04090 [Aspergillus mulundensis]